MTLFATPFLVPVAFSGYPVGLAIAVPETRQQLYFEREYVGTSVIRSTPITEPGFLYCQEFGPIPEGTTQIRACITNVDRKTEADPVITPPVTQDVPALFTTPFDRPVLFSGYPINLGIAIGDTRQTLFLDREYKTGNSTIAIRSDVIYERGILAHFNIHEALPPYGTDKILVSIRNEYRATEAMLLEYTEQEHNELEYN